MKLEKGIIGSFIMLLALVAIIGGFYLQQYIFAIVNGAVYNIGINGNPAVNGTVTNEAFTVTNVTNTSLAQDQIFNRTLIVFNASEVMGLANFTINYTGGIIRLATDSHINNSQSLLANYTYLSIPSTPMPITSDTRTYLATAEDSLYSVLGQTNTSAAFAGGLISVAIILLVFAGFIFAGKGLYGKIRGKGNNKDY